MNCNNGNFCWILLLILLFCNCGGNGLIGNGNCGCQSNNCGCESNNCGCC